MKNRKRIISLLLVAVVFLLFPKKILAVKLSMEKYTPYKGNYMYRTKGYTCNEHDGDRYLETFHQYFYGSGDSKKYYICIDYGKKFIEGDFTRKEFIWDTSLPKIYAYRDDCGGDPKSFNYKGKGTKDDFERLKKALSCYNSTHKRSSFAMQAISWELVSHERTSSFDPNKIYSGAKASAYAPNKELSNGLYNNVVYGHRNDNEASDAIYSEYKRILECASRFNVKPSGTGKTITMNQKTSATTSGAKATYSATKILQLSSKPAQSNLYAYYLCQIGSTKKPCKDGVTAKGVTFKCNSSYCSATTDEKYNGDNVEVTFIYAYKKASDYKTDKNGTLNWFGDSDNNKYKDDVAYFYEKANSQTVMLGNSHQTFSITLKKGTSPKYALRVQKLDNENKSKALQGAKFAVYKGTTIVSSCKEIVTGSDGIAKCEGLTATGNYTVKEISAPTGYNVIKSETKVTVKDSDTVANVNKITPVKIYNNPKRVVLYKRAVDENNKEVSITKMCETGTTCPATPEDSNEPTFTITLGNNKVCVKKTPTISTIPAGRERAGQKVYVYEYSRTAASCNSDETNEIRTCSGNFDIKNVPAESYVITEVKGACGATIDSKPTQTCNKANLEKGLDCVIKMSNGFTGVMFYKQNEAGILISGGKYSLQQKQNGVYVDIPLNKADTGLYEYSSTLTASSENIILTTDEGTLNVKGLPVGEYRFVEKEAPEGYDAIKDKDSTAVFKINDSGTPVETILINSKSKTQGSYDSAELIVTIITGRKVINYIAIIGGLGALLAALLLLRKKFKK